MTIKMLAQYKNWQIGDIIHDVKEDLADWLTSRSYAIRFDEKPALPPLQPAPPAKPLTTRKKKG